jgi:hypothetical protein
LPRGCRPLFDVLGAPRSRLALSESVGPTIILTSGVHLWPPRVFPWLLSTPLAPFMATAGPPQGACFCQRCRRLTCSCPAAPGHPCRDYHNPSQPCQSLILGSHSALKCMPKAYKPPFSFGTARRATRRSRCSSESIAPQSELRTQTWPRNPLRQLGSRPNPDDCRSLEPVPSIRSEVQVPRSL